jgi:hypothetical protein
MLKAIGCEDYIEIYDICSEIPRLTAVFNGIHTFNEIDDYYTFLIQKSGVSITRAEARKLFMRCYFERSDKVAWRNFINSKDFKEFPICKNDVLSFFEATKWELKPLGNFIFILTSYIEQAVLHEFREFKMLNVYDGFYSNYRLGGKIERFLNENCGKLLNKFGGIDKGKINQDHDLGYINQDHDQKIYINNILYPLCDTNLNPSDLEPGLDPVISICDTNLRDSVIPICDTNLEVPNTYNVARILEVPKQEDMLICGTNLEPRKKAHRIMIETPKQDNLICGTNLDSPIEKLNQVIIKNEKKYHDDQCLDFRQWDKLPPTEKAFYKAVRLSMGVGFIKNAENS